LRTDTFAPEKPAMYRVFVPAILAAAVAGGLAPTQDRPPISAIAPKPETTAIESFIRGYVDAFNKNQPEAVTSCWTPQCEYVDRETGERTVGRDAIRADMQKLFKENPGAKISVELGSVRFIRSDVAAIEGKSTAYFPKSDPNATAFSAVLVKEGDRWFVDSVQETALPTPPSSESALKELAWLVGDWKDDSPGITVECSAHWAANHSFLVRSYRVEKENQSPWEGTQIIGWDSRNKQIRSWTFDSDGSFDEAFWTRHGDTWQVVLTRTLDDGGMATGTQIMKKLSPDSYTVQMVAREINGEPAPSSEPVRVIRVVNKTETK
jgi:uncharacterized protein (TIGR02246 family)